MPPPPNSSGCSGHSRFPTEPVALLEPFRVANRYGLFGIMTRGRYEIEFQGSDDGKNWTPYPFRYKPQNLNEPPGIYAPYQPRFDWNLWFASLGSWREYPIVPNTEVRLLSNDEDVLALFKSNPFQEILHARCEPSSTNIGSPACPRRRKKTNGGAVNI